MEGDRNMSGSYWPRRLKDAEIFPLPPWAGWCVEREGAARFNQVKSNRLGRERGRQPPLQHIKSRAKVS